MNQDQQKYIERFWTKVDKDQSQVFYNGTRCWEWTDSRDGSGYGRIRIGKLVQSHRMSYELAFGKIPDGFQVLHRCDNPPCVNPDHLFLGTHQDNMDDKEKKGRHNAPRGGANGSRTHPEKLPRGESHGKHKLTDEQVSDIRRRYSRFGIGGENSYKLAKEFGVSPKQICNIVNYEQRK